MKILISCLLFTTIFLLIGCKQTENKTSKISTQTISSLPQIEGFFIFKRNMSFLEVSNMLTERKIKFRSISLEKQDEINHPLSWKYVISASDLKNFKNIRIIEGYNLPIINKNISRFQIGFFNDTIFYFNYEHNLEVEHNQNSEINGGLQFTNDINDDIALLQTLSQGLNHKYGYPFIHDGNLNAFYPSTNAFWQWDDDTHNGIQYSEKQVWLSNDSLTHIRLQNDCMIDSLKFQPYKIKIQGLTTIEVLFNSKYANKIQQFESEEYILQKREEKKNIDSLVKEKNKQFDSL